MYACHMPSTAGASARAMSANQRPGSLRVIQRSDQYYVPDMATLHIHLMLEPVFSDKHPLVMFLPIDAFGGHNTDYRTFGAFKTKGIPRLNSRAAMFSFMLAQAARGFGRLVLQLVCSHPEKGIVHGGGGSGSAGGVNWEATAAGGRKPIGYYAFLFKRMHQLRVPDEKSLPVTDQRASLHYNTTNIDMVSWLSKRVFKSAAAGHGLADLIELATPAHFTGPEDMEALEGGGGGGGGAQRRRPRGDGNVPDKLFGRELLVWMHLWSFSSPEEIHKMGRHVLQEADYAEAGLVILEGVRTSAAGDISHDDTSALLEGLKNYTGVFSHLFEPSTAARDCVEHHYRLNEAALARSVLDLEVKAEIHCLMGRQGAMPIPDNADYGTLSETWILPRELCHPLALRTTAMPHLCPPIDRLSVTYRDIRTREIGNFSGSANPERAFYEWYRKTYGSTVRELDGLNIEHLIAELRDDVRKIVGLSGAGGSPVYVQWQRQMLRRLEPMLRGEGVQLAEGLCERVAYLRSAENNNSSLVDILGGKLHLGGLGGSLLTSFLRVIMAFLDVGLLVTHLHVVMLSMFFLISNCGYDPVFNSLLQMQIVLSGHPACGKSFAVVTLAMELLVAFKKTNYRSTLADTSDTDRRGLVEVEEEITPEKLELACALDPIKLRRAMESDLEVRESNVARAVDKATSRTSGAEHLDLVAQPDGRRARRKTETVAVAISGEMWCTNLPLEAMTFKYRRRKFIIACGIDPGADNLTRVLTGDHAAEQEEVRRKIKSYGGAACKSLDSVTAIVHLLGACGFPGPNSSAFVENWCFATSEAKKVVGSRIRDVDMLDKTRALAQSITVTSALLRLGNLIGAPDPRQPLQMCRDVAHACPFLTVGAEASALAIDVTLGSKLNQFVLPSMPHVILGLRRLFGDVKGTGEGLLLRTDTKRAATSDGFGRYAVCYNFFCETQNVKSPENRVNILAQWILNTTNCGILKQSIIACLHFLGSAKSCATMTRKVAPPTAVQGTGAGIPTSFARGDVDNVLFLPPRGDPGIFHVYVLKSFLQQPVTNVVDVLLANMLPPGTCETWCRLALEPTERPSELMQRTMTREARGRAFSIVTGVDARDSISAAYLDVHDSFDNLSKNIEDMWRQGVGMEDVVALREAKEMERTYHDLPVFVRAAEVFLLLMDRRDSMCMLPDGTPDGYASSQGKQVTERETSHAADMVARAMTRLHPDPARRAEGSELWVALRNTIHQRLMINSMTKEAIREAYMATRAHIDAVMRGAAQQMDCVSRAGEEWLDRRMPKPSYMHRTPFSQGGDGKSSVEVFRDGICGWTTERETKLFSTGESTVRTRPDIWCSTVAAHLRSACGLRTYLAPFHVAYPPNDTMLQQLVQSMNREAVETRSAIERYLKTMAYGVRVLRLRKDKDPMHMSMVELFPYWQQDIHGERRELPVAHGGTATAAAAASGGDDDGHAAVAEAEAAAADASADDPMAQSVLAMRTWLFEVIAYRRSEREKRLLPVRLSSAEAPSPMESDDEKASSPVPVAVADAAAAAAAAGADTDGDDSRHAPAAEAAAAVDVAKKIEVSQEMLFATREALCKSVAMLALRCAHFFFQLRSNIGGLNYHITAMHCWWLVNDYFKLFPDDDGQMNVVNLFFRKQIASLLYSVIKRMVYDRTAIKPPADPLATAWDPVDGTVGRGVYFPPAVADDGLLSSSARAGRGGVTASQARPSQLRDDEKEEKEDEEEEFDEEANEAELARQLSDAMGAMQLDGNSAAVDSEFQKHDPRARVKFSQMCAPYTVYEEEADTNCDEEIAKEVKARLQPPGYIFGARGWLEARECAVSNALIIRPDAWQDLPNHAEYKRYEEAKAAALSRAAAERAARAAARSQHWSEGGDDAEDAVRAMDEDEDSVAVPAPPEMSLANRIKAYEAPIRRIVRVEAMRRAKADELAQCLMKRLYWHTSSEESAVLAAYFRERWKRLSPVVARSVEEQHGRQRKFTVVRCEDRVLSDRVHALPLADMLVQHGCAASVPANLQRSEETARMPVRAHTDPMEGEMPYLRILLGQVSPYDLNHADRKIATALRKAHRELGLFEKPPSRAVSPQVAVAASASGGAEDADDAELLGELVSLAREDGSMESGGEGKHPIRGDGAEGTGFGTHEGTGTLHGDETRMAMHPSSQRAVMEMMQRQERGMRAAMQAVDRAAEVKLSSLVDDRARYGTPSRSSSTGSGGGGDTVSDMATDGHAVTSSEPASLFEEVVSGRGDTGERRTPRVFPPLPPATETILVNEDSHMAHSTFLQATRQNEDLVEEEDL